MLQFIKVCAYAKPFIISVIVYNFKLLKLQTPDSKLPTFFLPLPPCQIGLLTHCSTLFDQ